MKAVVLNDYNTNLGRVLRSLSVTEKDLRPLQNHEVLIRIDAAPCHPSDIAFVRGLYNIIKRVPVIPGFEATGTVVNTGSHPEAAALLGKRVSCFTQDDQDGTWAEYFITKPAYCIPVKKELAVDQAACLAINPFTAAGLLQMARTGNHATVIQNAAAGQIGTFIRKLASKEGIRVINIVRKEEHVQWLLQQGETFVFDLVDDHFEEKLQTIAHELNTTLAFDAVGGDVTGKILNAMPAGARLVVYGGLASQQFGNINVLDVIFDGKSISGFNLGQWISQLSPEQFEIISSDLQERILRGEIGTTVQARYPLEMVVRGLLQYVGNMSDGKVLFVP
jgi:NADPH:quinone reductase-like Zn-dependent oxidoreductase